VSRANLETGARTYPRAERNPIARTDVRQAMSMKRLMVGLLIASIALAACSAGGQAVDTTDGVVGPCAADPVGEGRVLSCPLAVDLAGRKLGWLHWPVTATDFRWSLCPPNARCPFLPQDQGWVIFRFWAGDPVMIHVGRVDLGDIEAGPFVANDPEPLPDWLLEEISAAG
jgi:hypothetical protein